MNVSREVQEAREATAKALGLELDDVAYITEELLAQYETEAVDDEGVSVTDTGLRVIAQCPWRRDYHYQLCRPTIG